MQVSFRQVRCGRCAELFFICPPCDRGQEHCGDECAEAAHREAQRAARKRHQSSPEGRLDHRDHQRAYRERLGLRVMDMGSGELAAPATVCPRVNAPTSMDDAAVVDPRESIDG